MNRKTSLLGVAAGCLLVASHAAATTVLIDSSLNQYRPGLENQGWWPPTLGYSNFAESDYHFTGWTGSYPDTEVRSFFAFFLDPALLAGARVTAATLIVRKGGSAGDAGQETLGLFDVTSALSLVMHNVSTNAGVWTDLATGVSYGTKTFDVGGNPEENLEISLTSAGVQAINASIGDYFTLGAAITSGYGYVFGQSGAQGTQALALEISVPEPTTAAILSLALIAIGAFERRRRLAMNDVQTDRARRR